MVQYYTLEQAAQLLNLTPDRVKEMARKGEVRAFQDRGSLRFRTQEIDELARSMGLGSDPSLQLGDSSLPLAGDPPSSPSGSPRSPIPEDSGAVLDFQLADSGRTPRGPDAKSSPGDSSKRKPGPRPSTLKAPPPVSSDSDVRLVSDSSGLDFKLDDPADAPAQRSPRPASKSGSKSKLKPPADADSGVRIVPLDKSSDSDVKLVGESEDDRPAFGAQKPKKPSDSDIRIDGLDDLPPASGSKRRKSELITEEIDLDAEERSALPPSKKTPAPGKSKSKPQSGLPTSSPFELSEDDLKLQKSDDSSDEFTLAPDDGSADRSPLDASPLESSPLEAGSDEVPLIMGDEEVTLGELTGAGGGSGINLQQPADSGISLEQGGSDEIEFELTLDPDGSGMAKPASAQESTTAEDSSSEFELSIKEGDDSGSSSEFELTLDGEESAELSLDKQVEESGSDSEFELTLDDSGGLGGAEEAGEAEAGEDKDIFETDFEVPALDEESASEAVSLDSDTDVETQDFDLESSDSSSQVVELDDAAESGAATVKRPSKKRAALAAKDADTDLLADEEDIVEEEEDDAPARVEYRDAPSPEWGAAAPLGALLCTVVLFFVGVMAFELVQGMWGYHRGNAVSGPVVNWFAETVTGEKIPGNN